MAVVQRTHAKVGVCTTAAKKKTMAAKTNSGGGGGGGVSGGAAKGVEFTAGGKGLTPEDAGTVGKDEELRSARSVTTTVSTVDRSRNGASVVMFHKEIVRHVFPVARGARATTSSSWGKLSKRRPN